MLCVTECHEIVTSGARLIICQFREFGIQAWLYGFSQGRLTVLAVARRADYVHT
jgi:hypothetical protein